MSKLSFFSIAIGIQDEVGWNLLLEVLVAYKYYKLVRSRKSSKRCLDTLIRKLWVIAWDVKKE
jgi:hypothetical protein